MSKKYFYPIGKTKDVVDSKWYIADGFNSNRGTYFHSGVDWNLKTGGDTDLGQPLYAVGDGKIVYFHNNSHPTTGFGKHMVLRCETPYGTKWFHYAHCLEITPEVKDVKAGDVIGKLGKSGTKLAHLHFSVFHKDPKDHPRGIDLIDTDPATLDQYLEDPLPLLEKLYTYVENSPETDYKKLSERYKEERDACSIERSDLIEENKRLKIQLDTSKEDLKNYENRVEESYRELCNILDPDTPIDLPSESLVKNLAKQIVSDFSNLQSELLKKEREWSSVEKQLEEENSELEKQVKSLKQELEDMRLKHTQEIERLEKRLDRVSSDIEKNKESKAENNLFRDWIIKILGLRK